MKCFILGFLVAVAFAQHHVDFDKFMKHLHEIEQSTEFKNFDQTEVTLYQELLKAAQAGSTQLTTFIDHVGLGAVLKMVDHLDEDDIAHFEEILAYYSSGQQLGGGNFVGKRQTSSDLYMWMREMHAIDEVLDDLDHEDRRGFLEMMYAAEHNTLDEYIHKVGYPAAFRILSQMDKDYEHPIDSLIIQHLEIEKQMKANHAVTTTMPATMPTGQTKSV